MGMKYNGKLYKELLKHSTMKREFLKETGMMFEQDSSKGWREDTVWEKEE
jgi:hypothetical protein